MAFVDGHGLTQLDRKLPPFKLKRHVRRGGRDPWNIMIARRQIQTFHIVTVTHLEEISNRE